MGPALAEALRLPAAGHPHLGWGIEPVKFTLSWLKEHLDTDATPEEIGARLTSIGLEVESITDPGAGLKDFIVGEVVTAEKHPNADKLRLCSVSDGADTLQIVCA